MRHSRFAESHMAKGSNERFPCIHRASPHSKLSEPGTFADPSSIICGTVKGNRLWRLRTKLRGSAKISPVFACKQRALISIPWHRAPPEAADKRFKPGP